MADLVITASAVKPAVGFPLFTRSGVAGEALAAGDAVYRDPVTGKWKKAKATSAVEARAEGAVLEQTVAVDAPFLMATRDSVLDLGTAAPAKGVSFLLSGTPGGWSPHSDPTTPASGELNTELGVGLGNNLVRLTFRWSDAAVA